MSNANYDSSQITQYLRDRNLFAWNFYNSNLVQQGQSVRPEQHPPVSGQVTLNRVLGGVVDYRNGVELVPFEPAPVEEGGSTPAPPPPPPPASGGVVQWVTSISGVGNIFVQSTVVDTLGNIYIAGLYGGSTDASVNNQAGVSSQVINVTAAGDLPRYTFWSQEAFIAKYNSAGVAQWITKIDGDFSQGTISLATDSANNLYMTCSVSHNGSGVKLYEGGSGAIGPVYADISYNILPSSVYGTIVAKYLGVDGELLWATTIFNSSPNNCKSTCISIDIDNFIYIGGNFDGNQDTPFNKSITINSVTTPNVSEGIVQVSAYGTLTQGDKGGNSFVVKYNSNGIAQAATRLTSTGNDINDVNINSIYAYSNANIYVAGNYKNGITCSDYSSVTPGSPPTINITPYGVMSGVSNPDLFLVKYNTSLATQWVTRLGSTSFDSNPFITVDSAGNIIITGQYQTATPIDTLTVYNSATSSGGIINPQDSGFELSNSGSNAVLLVKYNSAGVAQWATRIDGTSNENSAVATIGSSDSIYVSCIYTTNPVSIYNSDTTNTTLVLGTGFNNLCLVKYDSAGIASWATSVGANSAANCFNTGGLAYYSGYIYVGNAQASFSTPLDPIGFNSSTGISGGVAGITLYGTLANAAAGGSDYANSFLAKYSA